MCERRQVKLSRTLVAMQSSIHNQTVRAGTTFTRLSVRCRFQRFLHR
jgi:hypothetical protein